MNHCLVKSKVIGIVQLDSIVIV